MVKVAAPSHTVEVARQVLTQKHEPGNRPMVVAQSISRLLPPDATIQQISVEKNKTEAGGPSKIGKSILLSAMAIGRR